MSPPALRIGVDVGGTNTDGVILDPAAAASPSRGILAWHKAPTTAPDPGAGIANALRALLASSAAPASAVASVTVGTTHFVNAVVERDPARLARVAVLRLCGPFSKHVPPCADWPPDLRRLVLGHYALLRGGLEVDGRAIAGGVDEAEVAAACAEIRARGIRAVVVNAVFGPIDAVADPERRQEGRAAAVVRREVPGADVVCASDVANLGFLERENAAILNAAILRFVRRTVRAFEKPVRELGMTCPVFVTQNDGTVLSGEMAARLPIRTFSSGPTNSMRGAAFLIRRQEETQKGENDEDGESLMVVDIGGTTTDVGLLLPNGFPRQQAAYSELAGVRMVGRFYLGLEPNLAPLIVGLRQNFSCPDIKSIGLGGGSIVRKGPPMTVGPDSVGYRLTKESIVFGGKTLTATDCAVCADPSLKIGNPDLVKGLLTDDELAEFKSVVKHKLERIIDTMKTSPADIDVVLVGGGAILAPGELRGARNVLKPQWSQVANAIGAAMARVSAVVDTIRSTETRTEHQLLEEIRKEAVEKTVAAGAAKETIEIVEEEVLPLNVRSLTHKARYRSTNSMASISRIRHASLFARLGTLISRGRTPPLGTRRRRRTSWIRGSKKNT